MVSGFVCVAIFACEVWSRLCMLCSERWELLVEWWDRSGLWPRPSLVVLWSPCWRQPAKSMTGREAAAARPQCGGGASQARTQFRPKATQGTLASNTTSDVIGMSSSSARRTRLARSPLRPEEGWWWWCRWRLGAGWPLWRHGYPSPGLLPSDGSPSPQTPSPLHLSAKEVEKPRTRKLW